MTDINGKKEVKLKHERKHLKENSCPVEWEKVRRANIRDVVFKIRLKAPAGFPKTSISGRRNRMNSSTELGSVSCAQEGRL